MCRVEGSVTTASGARVCRVAGWAATALRVCRVALLAVGGVVLA
jgi:hypothetical protein